MKDARVFTVNTMGRNAFRGYKNNQVVSFYDEVVAKNPWIQAAIKKGYLVEESVAEAEVVPEAAIEEKKPVARKNRKKKEAEPEPEAEVEVKAEEDKPAESTEE